MKIFIGFGYNERDAWIEEIIFNVLKELDIEIITGHDIYGMPLGAGVQQQIEDAHAVIAFLTRRKEGETVTHDWVLHELVTAIALKKKVVEVREVGVERTDGIIGDRQYIPLDLTQKEKVVLSLVKAVKLWQKEFNYKRIVLLPADVLNDIGPNFSKCKCYYQYLVEDVEFVEVETKLLKIGKGGLFVTLKGVPSQEAYVQLRIDGPGFTWSSPYTALTDISLHLEKQI